MDLPIVDDYHALLAGEKPLLDVRAPVEFSRGAFPTAVNHPLVDDQQRHDIGIVYKDHGQAAALDLGHRLVCDALREARIASWIDFAQRHPHGALYCFRGGQRSEIAQRWLYERSDIAYPRVRGGYKALRGFLIDSLARAAARLSPILIGGRTGVGKTRLLARLPRALDLEHLAWHRGSAFGRHATPQPSQINFENALAIRLLQLRADADERVVVEDEGRNVGSVKLPDALHACFKRGDLLVLEAPLAQRVQITLQEYVIDALHEYHVLHGQTEAFASWSAALFESLSRIRRRLGEVNYTRIDKLMRQAVCRHAQHGDLEPHRAWIQALLTEYYDPMYDYQLSRQGTRTSFAGNVDEIEHAVRAALS